MENSNNSLGKRNLPLPLIWIVSTILISAIFVMASIPRVQAQSRRQTDDGGNYSATIRTVFDFIQRNYIEEIEANVLFEGAMNGMFDALGDPYSSFMPASEMSDLGDTTRGSFGGVGLHIFKQTNSDGRPSYIEVASPIEDTPGWRAGINPGDLIVEINGESTAPLSSDEAVSKLRGTPGEEVQLLIRRGELLEFPVSIVRAVIEVPTTRYAMIGDIGYLRLLTFTPHTLERARDAINNFRASDYGALILDLRNNYGGLLDSAVGVANLFIEGGVVVSTRSRISQANNTFFARGRAAVNQDIPIVVLINRGSASASEIVAGALKDRGRAYLVGEKSFGKGSVQQVYPLNGAGFRLTTAHYYTPSDVNIDKIGIPPDREVLFPEISADDAEQLNALINDRRIGEFVRINPSPSPSHIDVFVLELIRQYGLDANLLRRMIRNELNRTTIAPAYDLDYDVQLQEAVRILREENFQLLMQNAKTLRTLQEEALQEEEFPLAS